MKIGVEIKVIKSLREVGVREGLGHSRKGKEGEANRLVREGFITSSLQQEKR